ncbi:MAG: OmpH family outer membrane protein, partial [Elusimicrobiales bacterium]|nr:OmpH family outer membrane protein [Elusimicrobiales bacterium]
MRFLFCFIFLYFLSFSLYSIEISLEENRAESGTIGYVDIKKIFDRFASESRQRFSNEIKKRQDEVELIKKELFQVKALKEKLIWEYEIAKVYEDFKSKIQLNSSTNISSISSQDVVLSTVSSIFETTMTVSNDLVKSSFLSEDSHNKETEPYITMPGVGKVPISMFKFSFSSSTALIESEIKRLDKNILELEKKILELKDKYNAEIAAEVEKENISVFKRIYKAIEEVARQEGISVVIDKRNILFGVKNIDLTDKVIE